MVNRLQKLKDEDYAIIYTGDKPEFASDFTILSSEEKIYDYIQNNFGFDTFTALYVLFSRIIVVLFSCFIVVLTYTLSFVDFIL